MNTNHENQAIALGAALLTLYHAYGSDTSLEVVQSRLLSHTSRHVCEPEAQIDRVTITLEPAHDVLAYALAQVAELLTGAPCSSSSKTQPPSRPQDEAADSEAVSLLTETFTAVCDECRVVALTPEAADVNGCGRVADGCGAYVSPTHAVFDPDGDVRGIGLSAHAARADAIRRTHARACRARDASQDAVRGFRSALAALSAV